MELEKKDGTFIISKEEHEFLNFAKEVIGKIRNNWFSSGRAWDKLYKMSEKLNERTKTDS